MDQEQGPRGIPRLSRLPMPRVSHDPSRPLSPTRQLVKVASRDSLRSANLSTLPYPRLPLAKPLGESISNSVKVRHGWTSNASDTLPEQKGLQDNPASSVSLDTTPPGFKGVFPILDDASENAAGQEVVVDENATPKPEVQKDKRRPRPSLSERTTETMSQLSPSPSPSATRSRTTSIDSIMGPPNRPASAVKASRPPTSTGVEALSSRISLTSTTKGSVVPTNLMNTKKPLSSPTIQSPRTIYTPPKAHIRGQSTHSGKPPKYLSTTVSVSHHASSHKRAATLSRDAEAGGLKPLKSTKTIDGRISPVKPSLASIFKDPPKAKPNSTKLDLSSLNAKHSGPTRPKTRSEKTVASSPTISPIPSKRKVVSATKKQQSTTQAEESPSKPSNSSAALRAQVAKAKAAAIKKTVTGTPTALDVTDTGPIVLNENKGLLQRRIQGAMTTGSLNISAMGLKEIPDDVMTMYEFDESNPTNWAETVDLVKLIAADNEIHELRPDSFPDWSVEELAADQEKSNQFAGLEVLDLHGNQLTEMPIGFRRLERLQSLNLSKNKLSLDALEVVCQIKNLRKLNIASNALAGTLSENIGKLTNLEVLDVSSNQLEVLPCSVSSLAKLKKLNISSNMFTSLPAGSFPDVIEIKATRNKLTGTLIPGAGSFQYLQTLEISENTLEAVSSGADVSMPNLLTLTVDGNCLVSLPDMSSMHKLVTLTASGNKLERFPAQFDQLASIKNVDFSNNSIQTIPESVCRMESLTVLNLLGNPLRERKYITMSTEDLKLHLAKRLISTDSSADVPSTLTVSSSTLDSLDYSTPSPLHKNVNGILDLSGKALTEIDLVLLDLSQPIHTLNLSGNNLTTFPVVLLIHPMLQYSLHTLDLSHNPLTGSDYLDTTLSLPCLHTLNVISTGMTSLDALTTNLSAPALQSLNISCHRLSGHLPWPRAFWPSVTTLLATDNWFSSIDVEAVRGLEALDVCNNEIESLPPKLGMLGHSTASKARGEKGRLRSFECSGNKFRVPRWQVIEKGTEAVLRDLRRMVPAGELDPEWADE